MTPRDYSKAAMAAYERGRQARRDEVNLCSCPEKKYRSAWHNGWDTENQKILAAVLVSSDDS
jgi:hypothetical protein